MSIEPNTTFKSNGGIPQGEPLISVRNLQKSFYGRKVLQGIDFDVFPGEMVAIIGPSGCGKSTILKLICGLLTPDAGTVKVQSKDIGLVFQGSALLNSLDVRDNLAIPLRDRKLSRAEEDKIISQKLQLVGLREHMYAFPNNLSGGQQKRTSFARAIVNDPKIILYDEPTTGLDPVMSTIIEDYMIELGNQYHPASIVVTHQYSTWTRTSDRVILLSAGKIVWQGSPQEAVKSENPYMKQFAHATREGPMLAQIQDL